MGEWNGSVGECDHPLCCLRRTLSLYFLELDMYQTTEKSNHFPLLLSVLCCPQSLQASSLPEQSSVNLVSVQIKINKRRNTVGMHSPQCANRVGGARVGWCLGLDHLS